MRGYSKLNPIKIRNHVKKFEGKMYQITLRNHVKNFEGEQATKQFTFHNDFHYSTIVYSYSKSARCISGIRWHEIARSVLFLIKSFYFSLSCHDCLMDEFNISNFFFRISITQQTKLIVTRSGGECFFRERLCRVNLANFHVSFKL